MMNWINKKRNKKGFTLIELIVVIAILGILAAIAIPRLSGSRDAAQLRADQGTARTIASAIAISEATYGTSTETGGGRTVARVNEFLDGELGAGNLTGWSIKTWDPIVITGPRGDVSLIATPAN